MNTSLAFDTYSYVRKLRDAGVEEEQAVIQTEALVDLVEHRLASKGDVALIIQDIKSLNTKITDLEIKIDTKIETKITALETKMETKFTALDTKITDIIKWIAGIFIAQTALIIGSMFTVMKMSQPPAYETRLSAPPAQELRLPAAPPAPTVSPPSR